MSIPAGNYTFLMKNKKPAPKSRDEF